MNIDTDEIMARSFSHALYRARGKIFKKTARLLTEVAFVKPDAA